jgi:hypothetical protein
MVAARLSVLLPVWAIGGERYQRPAATEVEPDSPGTAIDVVESGGSLSGS